MKSGIHSRLFLVVLLLGVHASAPVPAAADDAARGQGVAAVLQPFVDRHALAGAVTLVADRDKDLSLEAVGFADVAARKPLRTDALFWIASQSKPITAAALMMLVDEGKLSLDDPVKILMLQEVSDTVPCRRGRRLFSVRPPEFFWVDASREQVVNERHDFFGWLAAR